MVIIAIANGALRQSLFLNYMSELKAQQLSTVTLVVFCGIYLWIIFPVMHMESRSQALFTGLMYMILTTAFEFGLGWLNNRSWKFMLQDYDLFRGRIWPLFLLCMLLLPYLIYLFKTRK
jgi:hypothetical protein